VLITTTHTLLLAAVVSTTQKHYSIMKVVLYVASLVTISKIWAFTTTSLSGQNSVRQTVKLLVPRVGTTTTAEQQTMELITSSSSESNNPTSHRRTFLQKFPLSIGAVSMIVCTTTPVTAAAADEKMELPSKETVIQSFDAIRYELQDSNGGVSYMQSKIDQQDFTALMEFTKTYDLELRKKRMGTAKKLLQDKSIQETATQYSNAVTFDLIGINRSSRKGQENVESANKYLQELRDDVNKFLTLESTIQVQ
jgi:hypothetical protein